MNVNRFSKRFFIACVFICFLQYTNGQGQAVRDGEYYESLGDSLFNIDLEEVAFDKYVLAEDTYQEAKNYKAQVKKTK